MATPWGTAFQGENSRREPRLQVGEPPSVSWLLLLLVRLIISGAMPCHVSPKHSKPHWQPILQSHRLFKEGGVMRVSTFVSLPFIQVRTESYLDMPISHSLNHSFIHPSIRYFRWLWIRSTFTFRMGSLFYMLLSVRCFSWTGCGWWHTFFHCFLSVLPEGISTHQTRILESHCLCA